MTIALHSELDVIASRQRARQIASLCGFGNQDQTRIATAVSELARNAIVFAHAGTVRFLLGEMAQQQSLVITIDDDGPGIAAFDTYWSELSGVGSDRGGGISAARRFMERCEIDTGSHGTHVVLGKSLPAMAPRLSVNTLGSAIAALGSLPSNVALSEANQQNRELTEALATLQIKQAELLDLSRKLEETNRQVESLNQLLIAKADSLASADRRKDEFLSTLSHELRGPLSAAAMAAQLLEKNPDPEHKSVALGQVIGRQVKHMSRLVEDLLDVSRVSRGLVSVAKVPVDMRAVVEAALEQLIATARAKRQTVSVVLPAMDCTILGDRTRLVQIVGNLLGNAIRYTRENERIKVQASANDREVSVRVSDNGVGIAPALMPHLFDLYTQAERSADSRNSGLGLGLALVKSLVEAHKGSVIATSSGEGCGSQFEVRFALAA